MKGNIVITSNEPYKIPEDLDMYYTATEDVKQDAIVWYFKTEDEAIRASRIFMNSGFERVQRVI